MSGIIVLNICTYVFYARYFHHKQWGYHFLTSLFQIILPKLSLKIHIS